MLVSQLKAMGIECIASTTGRNAEEFWDGRKISDFKFVRFRRYLSIDTNSFFDLLNSVGCKKMTITIVKELVILHLFCRRMPIIDCYTDKYIIYGV